MTDFSYSEEFFDQRRSGVRRSAERISRWLYDLLSPRSVLDVGCGTGGWLAAFQRCGVADVFGVDGDWVLREYLEIAPENFRAVDLRLPLDNARRFDLVVCLEVAEHLPESSAATLVKSLTSAGSVILFSAAVPHQGGTGHLNERWPDYWVALFRDHGHVCVDCLRGRFWNDDQVAWWYAENSLLFVSERAPVALGRLRDEARRFPLAGVSVVHPKLYEAKIRQLSNPASYSLWGICRVFPTLFFRRFRAAFRRNPE